MSIYNFNVTRNDGSEASLKEYEGKVLLIINSATGCGFTPQYGELEDMYEQLNEKGFEILDFPCNQFGNQAPGTDEEIMDFCDSRYGIKFPLFKKIEVNGENAEPLFKFLKEAQPFSKVKGFAKNTTMKLLGKLSKTSKSDNDIRWNFTKFLVDRNGNVVDRFEPVEKLEDVKKAIEELL